METLVDYIRPNLEILSIGLNPSTISVEKGFYFANPRNRFWKAFNASGLVPIILEPSEVTHEVLLEMYKIGFTDVVKRHSAMGKDLRAADYRQWSPVLKAMIIKNKPRICWFHGKVALQNYWAHAEQKKLCLEWGLQPFKIRESLVFVTPNPSPANAAFSLQVITEWYSELSSLMNEV